MIYSVPHPDPTVGYLYFYHPNEDPPSAVPSVDPARLVPAMDIAPSVPATAVYVGAGLNCRGIRATSHKRRERSHPSRTDGDALFDGAFRFFLFWALGKITDHL